MPTTSNFGWTTPADTDLVKDGAAAIRTLGNGIDTSFLDLKGGTTGQVLSKASNTDLDFSWVAQYDSNAIQNAIVDAKGDLISATAADTPARLAVGTNGQVLTADSTTATGLKWAAPAAASGPAFRAYRGTSNQSYSANTWTKVQLNAETYDTANAFDSTTNYRFTPLTSGYYQINAQIFHVGGSRSRIAIYKNGSLNSEGDYNDVTADGNNSTGVADLINFNGSSDYIELYVFNSSASAVYNSQSASFFSGVWIRS